MLDAACTVEGAPCLSAQFVVFAIESLEFVDETFNNMVAHCCSVWSNAGMY